MPGRMNGDMPETQSPESSGFRGSIFARRVALLTLLAAIVLISILWATLSLSSSGEEAQAQTSSGESAESREIAQRQPDNQQGEQGDAAQDREGGEEDYAAFGARENPFEPVVNVASESEASGADSGGEDGSGEGGSAGEGTSSDNGDNDPETDAGATTSDSDGLDGNSAGNQIGGSGETGGDNGDDSGNGLNNGLGGENDDLDQDSDSESVSESDVVTGPNGEQVDCGNPADEFERLICAEERREAGSPLGTGDAPGGVQQPGETGSGGSGRSGAGEPEDDFRNGGGGARK